MCKTRIIFVKTLNKWKHIKAINAVANISHPTDVTRKGLDMLKIPAEIMLLWNLQTISSAALIKTLALLGCTTEKLHSVRQ